MAKYLMLGKHLQCLQLLWNPKNRSKLGEKVEIA